MKLIISFIFILTCPFFPASGQTERDSPLNKILSGNDDVSLIFDFYRVNSSLSDDSLNKLLAISDSNYLRNDKRRNANPDLQLRQIMFFDQLFRTKCYNHKLFDYSVVQKNDIDLQNTFLKIIQKHPDLDLLTNLTYQATFDLLLIHSVTTLEKGFFDNNFYKFSKAFSNNFKDFDNLKQLVDIYLNSKYQKHYFGTEYGKGKLSNGSFGLLPRMTDHDFRKVLTDLKIKDAVY